MSGSFDLIVFDWDGTLMNSTGLIALCIQSAAHDTGLPVPDERAAKYVIGLGLEDATATLFPHNTASERMAFAMRFRYHYVSRDHEAPLYDGVESMLAGLKRNDRFMAIATGKPRAGLDRALAHTGLRGYFDFTRCADEGFPKPHPGMLHALMDCCAVEPERVLMIGDTTHDLQLAANAGTSAIAVSYGAHDSSEFQQHRPLAVMRSIQELGEWLNRHA